MGPVPGASFFLAAVRRGCHCFIEAALGGLWARKSTPAGMSELADPLARFGAGDGPTGWWRDIQTVGGRGAEGSGARPEAGGLRGEASRGGGTALFKRRWGEAAASRTFGSLRPSRQHRPRASEDGGQRGPGPARVSRRPPPRGAPKPLGGLRRAWFPRIRIDKVAVILGRRSGAERAAPAACSNAVEASHTNPTARRRPRRIRQLDPFRRVDRTQMGASYYAVGLQYAEGRRRPDSAEGRGGMSVQTDGSPYFSRGPAVGARLSAARGSTAGAVVRRRRSTVCAGRRHRGRRKKRDSARWRHHFAGLRGVENR